MTATRTSAEGPVVAEGIQHDSGKDFTVPDKVHIMPGCWLHIGRIGPDCRHLAATGRLNGVQTGRADAKSRTEFKRNDRRMIPPQCAGLARK